MPRLPKYCHHKPSNRAFVKLNGKFVYLGEYDSEGSRREYDRVIAEWLENGRRIASSEPLIGELIIAWAAHARKHYRNARGELTGTHKDFYTALHSLKDSHALEPVSEFTPRKLKAMRERWIEAGHSRRYINDNTARIKQVFKWGVSEELVSEATWHKLVCVRSLEAHRSDARETDPVLPVSREVIEATLEHLGEVVGDIVRLQLLLACRPGELCDMRPADIDRSGEVWKYTPETHKTQHHGKPRVIMIGPQAQAILSRYLLRDPASYCFSPAEAERKRRQRMHANRRTPINHGNKPGSVSRKYRDQYNKDSYGTAVRRAAKKAGVERWSPNRLRHTQATTLREMFGIEAVQVTLGHARIATSEIYAERNLALAEQIAAQIG